MICNLGDPMSLRHPVQPIAFEVSFLQSQISIDNLVRECHVPSNIGLVCLLFCFVLWYWFCLFVVLFCLTQTHTHKHTHVPSKRDPWDWDWRLRINDTPNIIVCTWIHLLQCHFFNLKSQSIILFVSATSHRKETPEIEIGDYE